MPEIPALFDTVHTVFSLRGMKATGWGMSEGEANDSGSVQPALLVPRQRPGSMSSHLFQDSLQFFAIFAIEIRTVRRC